MGRKCTCFYVRASHFRLQVSYMRHYMSVCPNCAGKDIYAEDILTHHRVDAHKILINLQYGSF